MNMDKPNNNNNNNPMKLNLNKGSNISKRPNNNQKLNKTIA
jgi:hypothetical protein